MLKYCFDKIQKSLWLFLSCFITLFSCNKIEENKEKTDYILAGNWYYIEHDELNFTEYDSLYREVYFSQELGMINSGLSGPWIDVDIFSYRIENDSVYKNDLGEGYKEEFMFKVLSATENTILAEISNKNKYVLRRLDDHAVNLFNYLRVPDSLEWKLLQDGQDRMVNYFEKK